MTINFRILLSIWILGLLLIIVGIVDTFKVVDEYQDAAAAVEINDASDHLLKAAGALAVERGTTAGSLGNPSKMTRKQEETIDAKRREAQESLDAALAIISEHGSGLLEQDIRSVRRDLEALNGIRAEVDQILNRREDKAFPDLQRKAFGASTKLIMDSQALRLHEEGQLGGNVNSSVVLGFGIRHNLWIASEYSGRERGYISGVIGRGDSLSTSDLQRLGIGRGFVESGWSTAYLEKEELSEEFVATMEKARTVYFNEFSVLRTKVYEAGATGDYPVTASEWFNAATAGIKVLLDAQGVARQDIRALLDQTMSNAVFWLVVDIIILTASVVILCFSVYTVRKRVVLPLKEIQNALTALSQGQLDVHVPHIEHDDEIGQMAKATYRFKQESRAAARYREEQEQYRLQVKRENHESLLQLADGFESEVGHVIAALSSSATELAATSGDVNGIAARTAGRSEAVKEAADEASGDLETVSSAIEQVSAAVRGMSTEISETSTLTHKAVDHAEAAVAKVETLNEASAKIKDIVSLISDIAEQTNLLALNATIESARAGDAGKGFAVVANEVKTLANQTQSATDEIGAQVNSMLNEISESTKAVHGITDAVRQTNETMASIANTVDEQAGATNEVAMSTRNAAEKIKSVVNDIISVSDDATATGGATEQLRVAADELSHNSSILTHETQEFIGNIRNQDLDAKESDPELF